MLAWITSLLDTFGLIGVGLLMFVENVFPPIPSELVMPLAGFTAADGRLALGGVILAGLIGSVAGAAFWFWVGQRLGAERLKALAARHGRWLTLTPRDIDAASDWFERHGRSAVLFGRLVPAVRTLISVPAGVSGMPLGRFLLWSGLGTFFWVSLLAVAGYMLESQYERVSSWLNPVSTAVLAGLVGLYLWRVWRFDPSPGTAGPEARLTGRDATGTAPSARARGTATPGSPRS